MTTLGAVVAVVLALAGGARPVTADSVCRPNALGTTVCADAPVRPKPRPIFGDPVQALDRVPARPATDPSPGFVPARDTERLGGTVTRAPVGAGRCRPDTLGNLRCP